MLIKMYILLIKEVKFHVKLLEHGLQMLNLRFTNISLSKTSMSTSEIN